MAMGDLAERLPQASGPGSPGATIRQRAVRGVACVSSYGDLNAVLSWLNRLKGRVVAGARSFL